MARRKKVVSILDYRASRTISNIRTMLDKASGKQKVDPSNWRIIEKRFKSLTVFDNGSCMLHTLSAVSMARRQTKSLNIKDY